MQVHQNYQLQKYNTFGINVIAKYFSKFSSVQELQELLTEKINVKKLILGGGSNILFTQNYEGFVLKNEIPGIDMVGEDDEYIFITGRRRCFVAFICYFCVNNNFGGVENLSLDSRQCGRFAHAKYRSLRC